MRFIIAFLAALLMYAPADAQLTTMGMSKSTTGGGGYSGPGDVQSGAITFYSFRAYNAAQATAGAKALNACTALDALCTDIHVTSTGGLSASDIVTSTCAPTNCTLKTWYDQSGNAHDITETTIVQRPTFNTSLQNGLPGLSCPGSAIMQGTIPNTNPGYSFTAGVNASVNPGGTAAVVATSTPTGLFFTTNPNAFFYAGSAHVSSATLSTSTYYRLIGRTDGSGNGVISTNGTLVTGNGGNSGTGTSIAICQEVGGGASFTANLVEVGLWGTNFSSGVTTSMDSNISAYWGF